MSKPDVIDLDTIVTQTANLMTSEFEGETVMMSLEKAFYYGVDSTAQRIWKLIAQPRRVSEICNQLIAEYAVDRKVCEKQVCAFLAELHREGLIRIADETHA